MSICVSPPLPVIGLLSFITHPCEFYSGVVLFSFIFRVRDRVRVSYRVRVRV